MPHQKGENCHKAELLQLFTILRNYIKKKKTKKTKTKNKNPTVAKVVSLKNQEFENPI